MSLKAFKKLNNNFFKIQIRKSNSKARNQSIFNSKLKVIININKDKKTSTLK